MAKYAIGCRVGAILNIDNDAKVANLIGYGVYQGDKPHPDMGGFNNPNIKLDNGDEVWGMECWWGPEDEIKQAIEGARSGGFTINTVDMKAERAKFCDA